jgi:hypothetical protein
MTWWDWLILSIVAWVGADVLLVALFAWRPPRLQTSRPNVNGPEGKPGAEVET